MRWLVIIAIVVVAGFLGYRYYATERGQEVVAHVQETATTATEAVKDAAGQASDAAQQAVAELTVNGGDLGEAIGTTVSDATGALEGITDKASAEAALPSLAAVEAKIKELGAGVEGLSQPAQEALASLLADGLPTLEALVTKVEAIEGVGPVVKPTLDAIMAKLDAWATPPA